MVRADHADLERALRHAAAEIDIGDGTELLDRVAARIGGQRSRRAVPPALRRTLVAAAVVAAVALAAAALPPARHALADLFGLRGVRIEQSPTTAAPTGSWSAGLRPTTEAEAAADLGVPLRRLDPRRYGQPTGWSRSSNETGFVIAFYPPSDRLPPSPGQPGIGALLGQIRGRIEGPVLGKVIGPNARLEPVTVAGHPGYWITGDHQVGLLGRDGQFVVDAARLAGNTLLWQDGDVTYRLETGLGRDDAIAAANSLR